MELVYNRSAADANKRLQVKAKLKAGFASEEDYQYWLRGEAVPLYDRNGTRVQLTEGEGVFGREGFLRGAYNFVDLNRVGAWVQLLADRFHVLPQLIATYRQEHALAPDPIYLVPYSVETVSVNPKCDWQKEDAPSLKQAERYLSDLSLLRGVIALPASTPSVPDDLHKLTQAEANAIEELLGVIDVAITELHAYKNSLIDRAAISQLYSGETFTEEGLY